MRKIEHSDLTIGTYVWNRGESYMHAWDCPGIITAVTQSTFTVLYFDDMKEKVHHFTAETLPVLTIPTNGEVLKYILRRKSNLEVKSVDLKEKIMSLEVDINELQKYETVLRAA